ncbi:MAG: virulence RhuM family protein [Tannerella sp.]|nr:virulence RhuM family protein [Tannerella sp.]
MILLFGRDQSVISKHIRNVFAEGELDKKSNMQNLHIANSDKPVFFYSLDVIISVGYRVKSQQGTQFRIWATKILKEHLLKGYTINKRMDRLEDKVETIATKVSEIDLQINSNLIPTQGVFFDGQVFDAYGLASKIIRSAKQNIILIDNYIDKNTLTHLAKKKKSVKVLLLTKITGKLNLDIQKANAQYGGFEAKEFSQSHDRFLIIDNGKEIYHLGASLKDLGKKWFAFSKMDKVSVDSIVKAVSKLI